MRRTDDPYGDPIQPEPEVIPPRIFLREPGWRVGLKVGSERVFCYQANPGEDFYHRLADGELFIYHGDERLCLPCAGRRGLLAHEPRPLRQPFVSIEEFEDAGSTAPYEVREPEEQIPKGFR